MKIRSLPDLLAYQIKLLRGAEKQLSAALGRLSVEVSSAELALTLQHQAGGCFGRSRRLKEVAETTGRRCVPRSCDPVLAMAEEGRVIASKSKSNVSVRDAALVLLVQRAHAYLVAAYRSGATLARQVKNSSAATLLDSCVDEILTTKEELEALGATLMGPTGERDLDADFSGHPSLSSRRGIA